MFRRACPARGSTLEARSEAAHLQGGSPSPTPGDQHAETKKENQPDAA